MAVGNLLGGFLQGFSQARDQKLARQQQQDQIKLQAKQYQQKLEEQAQRKEALDQLTGLLMPQPSMGPPTAQGMPAAPEQPRKSLMDLMVDPELQALMLKSGQMDMGDLVKMQGQQQTQNMFERFMGGDQSAPGAMRPKGMTLDAQGRPSLSFEREPTPTIEQSVGAQGMIDAQQSASSVGSWLTNGKSKIGAGDYAQNIDLGKLASLATRTGEGAQYYDDMIRAVMNIVSIKAGKTITESEAERILGPMLPQIGDVTSMLNLFGSGDLIQVENLRTNAASKLQSLQSLINGTMEAEEIQKMLRARGIETKGRRTGEARTQPLPERGEVRGFVYNPKTGKVEPQ